MLDRDDAEERTQNALEEILPKQIRRAERDIRERADLGYNHVTVQVHSGCIEQVAAEFRRRLFNTRIVTGGVFISWDSVAPKGLKLE